MQLGRGELIPDTARVLSRYVDAIMIRILDHRDLDELARYASVPVINGLTKRSHPCQVMADLMTFEEHEIRIVKCDGTRFETSESESAEAIDAGSAILPADGGAKPAKLPEVKGCWKTV